MAGRPKRRPWRAEEKRRFLELVKDNLHKASGWKIAIGKIKGRSDNQLKSHFQAIRTRMAKTQGKPAAQQARTILHFFPWETSGDPNSVEDSKTDGRCASLTSDDSGAGASRAHASNEGLVLLSESAENGDVQQKKKKVD